MLETLGTNLVRWNFSPCHEEISRCSVPSGRSPASTDLNYHGNDACTKGFARLGTQGVSAANSPTTGRVLSSKVKMSLRSIRLSSKSMMCNDDVLTILKINRIASSKLVLVYSDTVSMLGLGVGSTQALNHFLGSWGQTNGVDDHRV